MADTPDPKILKQAASMLDKMGLTAAEITEAFKEMGPALVASMAGANAEYEQLEKFSQTIKKNLDQAKKQGQLTKANLQLETLRLQKQQSILEAKMEVVGADKEALQLEIDKLEVQQKQVQAQGKAAGLAQSYAKTLTGVSANWRSGLFGAFLDGGIEDSMIAVSSALLEQFSIANMLGSSLEKVAEATAFMVTSADKQFASVNKLTNGTGEYNDMIMDTMQHNAEWNVSMEDAGEAVSELYTGMSQFTEMTEEAQGQLVEATAQLKGLGIDSATTAANFEILNKSLGMTAEQAIAVQKDFAAMAADLGVSAGKISKDFAANSDVFTAYGDEATRVFKEVAAAAKATGIEMQVLLGITTQFDTFEGAAQSAGKLNAILGGGVLDSMELLNASEEERVRLLIQSIELSGKQWSSMNKFERIAVANAAGVSDMTEANKLFGQSLSEYDKAQTKVEDNAEAQKKLEERAAAAANMQDKLARIMEQFAVAVTPIVNAIHWMLDGFLQLNDLTGGMLVPTMITLLGVMAAAYYHAQILAFWEGVVAAKTTLLTWAKAAKTAATNLDTTSMFTNTAATQSNTLATIRASAATAWNTIKTQASALATKISTFFNWGQAASQTAVGATAAGAAPGTFVLSRGITAIGKAARKFLPEILALAAAMIGLGLAIAAPLILVAVIIWSLKDLTIAMLEMTDAIGPALLGLVTFIGIVALGLPVLALSIVSFFWILSSAITPIMLLQPVLPTMIFALLGIGVALWILGNAIKQFVGDGMPGAMLLAVASLWAFSISLIMLAPWMTTGAFLVGGAIALLGLGLLLLGKGLQEWNDVGVGAAVLALVSLWAFSYSLIALAPWMTMGAFTVGAAVLLLGFGLLMLGKGLQEWNDVGFGEAVLALASLWAFSISLIMLAPWMTLGAFLVGGAVLLLGFGLLILARGLQEWNDVGVGAAALALVSLWAFGISLIMLAPYMTLGAFLVGGAVLLLGFGLMILARGLQEWNNVGVGASVLALASLWAFGIGLAVIGPLLAKAGAAFLIGAVIVALGLLILNYPLRMFAETMAILAPIAGALPAIAWGLATLGLAMIPFAFGMTVLGIAAMLPFFKTGLTALGKALTMFGKAMGAISEEKAIALGQIFQGLAVFSFLDGIADIMWDLAWGILWIGEALSTIPESKALTFSMTADSLAKLIDSSVQLTPEVVANVEGMAKAAREYASAQKAMKEPSKDAFVEALRQVMGEQRSAGASKEKKGQDIVLELDGDEFARAVNAAIDSKHGLKGF